MGRLAIRRVEYFGDRYTFVSPDLPDGLVIIEGPNGSGKTTLSDMIYFAMGGAVKKFAKSGNDQHLEIQTDTNNGVRLIFEIDGARYFSTRRFDAPQDILVASSMDDDVQVYPIYRGKSDREVFSDWILEKLGIHVVTLFAGTRSGKLNFTDVLRLIYHDQDLDPSRVFKRPDAESFVTDSREFRRAVFEIIIGKASEQYYEALGKLKLAEIGLARRQAEVDVYSSAAFRLRAGESSNAEFLKRRIGELEAQSTLLQRARAEHRRIGANTPASDAELLGLRHELTAVEAAIAVTERQQGEAREERIRLVSLRRQLSGEVERIQKIIHAHETLSLFSPDTCPCCLRKVDRPRGYCVCGQTVDEGAYQRFFYGSNEYMSILKSKQKNIETVDAALEDCDKDLAKEEEARTRHLREASRIRSRMERWAGVADQYTTELETIDDELLEVRVKIERIQGQLEVELERDKLQAQINSARAQVDGLRQQTRVLEMAAEKDRATKVNHFEAVYTRLLRSALKEARVARLSNDYEPIINEGVYREASATVARRLMYYLTLLEMALEDPTMPFPRFLLVDTPETAGIDFESLSLAIGLIDEVLASFKKQPAQVILTTGKGRYPAAVRERCVVLTLDNDNRLLKRRESTAL